MVISELWGRLGNGLFMLSIGLYISKKIGVKFAIKPSSICNNNERLHYYDQEIFPFEFFRQFNTLDRDYDISKYQKIMHPKKYNSYKDFPLKNNIIIRDWFINKNYVCYDLIKDIFVPSKELTEEIFDLYNPTRNSLAINLRRGDYLWNYNQDRGYYVLSADYVKNAYQFLNKSYDKVFVLSDDIDWCEQNLDFCDNFVFVNKETQNSKIFFDLFLQYFVGDHIISPSTFCWWAQYLNPNPEKIVIAPYPWRIGKNNDDLFITDKMIQLDINTYQKIK